MGREATCRAGVGAVLDGPCRMMEADLDPAGIIDRWLCRKVLLVRRPLTEECLPSWAHSTLCSLERGRLSACLAQRACHYRSSLLQG